MDLHHHTPAATLPKIRYSLPWQRLVGRLITVVHQTSPQNWPISDLDTPSPAQRALDMAMGGFFPIELQLETMLDRLEQKS